MRRRAGGFSLLELLVVMALISLLVAIVTPSFFNDRTRSFNAAVQTAFQALKRARMEAVVERRSRSVLFGKPDADSESALAWSHEDIEVELSDGEDGDTRRITRIHFFPDGSSDGGTLTFRDERLSKRIVVWPESGLIEIERE